MCLEKRWIGGEGWGGCLSPEGAADETEVLYHLESTAIYFHLNVSLKREEPFVSFGAAHDCT